MKTCLNCKEEKSFTDFHKNRSRKDGLASWCKSCNCVYTKKWYRANREKAKTYRREFYAAHPGENKAYNLATRDRRKAYYIENREEIERKKKRYRAENLEKHRAYGRKWAAANRGKTIEKGIRYKARKKNAYIAPVNRQEIFIRDNGKCHICKKKVDPKNWHLEHIIPFALDGTHEPKNVAVSHPLCNAQKGTKGTAQLRLSGDFS